MTDTNLVLPANTATEKKTPKQRALEDLQRFRKRNNVEIDYKAELAKGREEKYEGVSDFSCRKKMI